MNFIERLPDEIILKIFKELKFKELAQCAQVCKKFRHITQDEYLWQKINLYEKKVTPEFIAHILKQKTKYLNLFCAKIPKPCKELKSYYFPKGTSMYYVITKGGGRGSAKCLCLLTGGQGVILT